MRLLFIKAEQLSMFGGLVDKLVPVKASVDKHGVTRAPGFAHRKVRAPEPETPDLFADGHDNGVSNTHVAPESAKKGPEVPGKGVETADSPKPMVQPSHPASATVAPVGAAAMGQRQENAGERFIDAVMEQFDLTRDEAKVALATMQKRKLVKLDPVSGQFNLKNGSAWEREYIREAAGLPSSDETKPGKNPGFNRVAETKTPGGETVSGNSETLGPQIIGGPGVNYDRPFPEVEASIAEFGVPAGTTKGERIAANKAAVDLLDSQYEPTDANLAVLARYSGNGGVGDSLNEYYTDTGIAAAMWAVLKRIGLPDNAAVLEPSCATGVFLHTAPVGVRVTGIELDGTSARIAQAIHGDRHEIKHSALELAVQSDDREYDAVIGNAPFGLRGDLIKQDKPDLHTAEQYFLDTSLDKAKGGGVVAMIVPTGVMDSANGRAARARLLRKAQFIGAARLPNTAFEAGHTEVTTDVVFLRKRDPEAAGALMAMPAAIVEATGVWGDEEFLAGKYFTGRGAVNIFGTQTDGWRAKAGMGSDITVEGSMVGVAEGLAEFVPEDGGHAPMLSDVLAACGEDEKLKQKALGGAAKRPYALVKVGDTKVIDGIAYVLKGKPPRWHRVDELMSTPKLASAVELGAAIDSLMTGYGVDAPGLREKLSAWVTEHGIPSKDPDVLMAADQDRRLWRLIGAVKPDGSFSEAVTGQARAAETGDFDVVAATMTMERGSFTVPELAERVAGLEDEDATERLYADNDYALLPGGKWATKSVYLTGALWPKLDALREALEDKALDTATRGKFEQQAKELEDTIAPVLLDDVDIGIVSAFIPHDILATFFTERNRDSGNDYQRDLERVRITFKNGVYEITGGGYEMNMVRDFLNRDGFRRDDLPKIHAINEAYKAWLCASRFREQVENKYNRTFRGYAETEYSNEPLEVPGLANKDKIKPHVWSAVRRALADGKGILADDVGLGKTVQGLLLARMRKISGSVRKPIIIPPKSVLANWVAECEKWFPEARVLVIGENYKQGADGAFVRDEHGALIGKADSPAERNRKWHDFTQNDYDFVLVSEPAFQDVDLSPDRKNQYLDGELWAQRAKALDRAGDKRAKKIREQFAQKAAGRDFQKRTDAIYFDDLGVDCVIYDEMHHAKNLWAKETRYGGNDPKFLGGGGESSRAFDWYFKAKWLREANGGRNVYGLTATPTKNSPVEIYSMLAFIAPDEFTLRGISSVADFIDRYCLFEDGMYLDTAGKIQQGSITKGFKNMDELRAIMARWIGRRTAKDVNLKLPDRQDQQHLVDMSPAQQSEYQALRELALDSDMRSTGEGHIFSIMDKMNKAATDLGLLDDKYADDESPKLQAIVKAVMSGAKDGGQIIFADYLGVHSKLRDMLVRAGVDASRIGIINAQATPKSSARQVIADKFNAGKLDFVIGNTATMGEGLNLQIRTTDMHDVDITWDPASMQQRHGRGLRQGNLNEAIRIHSYLSKGSFDACRWQSQSAKQDWMDLLWHGGDTVENLNVQGVMSRDEFLIMMSADPDGERERIAEDMKAKAEAYDTEQRAQAGQQFRRLGRMRQSFGSLKDKTTKTALKLQEGIERLRTTLQSSKYFEHKDALTGNTPVAISKVGAVYRVGDGIEGSADNHLDGKWLVAGADPVENTVTVRRWGMAGGRRLTVNADDLAGVKPFKSTPAAEQEAAKDFLLSKKTDKELTSFAQLRGMPDAFLEEHAADIQRKIRASAGAYSFRFADDSHGYSPDPKAIAVLEDGVPALKQIYELRGAGAADLPIMLPTEATRKALLEHAITERQGRRVRQEASSSRGRSSSSLSFKSVYGKYSDTPEWTEAGKALFGSKFDDEVKAAVVSRGITAARHAPDMTTAFDALLPTLTVGYHDTKWPKRGLAVLWAQARRQGALETPAADAFGFARWTRYSSDDMGKMALFADWKGKTTREAILHAAAKSKDFKLAAAMLMSESSPKKYDVNILRQMVKLAPMTDIAEDRYGGGVRRNRKWPLDLLEAMRHIVAARPELASMPLTDLDLGAHEDRVFGTHSRPSAATLGQALKEAIGDEIDGEASDETAATGDDGDATRT